jgi:hypothetical protein
LILLVFLSLFSYHLTLHYVPSLNYRLSSLIFFVWSHVIIFSEKIYIIETSDKSLYFSIQKRDILVCDFNLRMNLTLHHFKKKLSELNISLTQESVRWSNSMKLPYYLSFLICLPIFDFSSTLPHPFSDLLKWKLKKFLKISSNLPLRSK